MQMLCTGGLYDICNRNFLTKKEQRSNEDQHCIVKWLQAQLQHCKVYLEGQEGSIKSDTGMNFFDLQNRLDTVLHHKHLGMYKY